MHENKYNHYRIPAGLLITFLEKALLLIHMETHLNDVGTIFNITAKIAYLYRVCIERGNQDLPTTIHFTKPALL
jgi:hypothetical protein